MAGPALAIRRFALAIEAPGAKAPELARRATQAVRERLPAALGERLFATADGPLLMIRRLELDMTVLEGDDAGMIAERLADAIALAVAGASAPSPAAAGAEERDAMPRFASRAALTAAFLAALAGAGNVDSWWFRSFEGVRLLAPSAAARTVLLRDPSGMGEVFAALSPAARARLSALLREADAGLLLDALCALPAGPGIGDRDWIPLAAALRASTARAPLARAMEALIGLAADPAAQIGGETATAARSAALRPGPGRSGDRAATALDRRWPLPEPLRAALESQSTHAFPGASNSPLFSRLGGYALLLPSLLELDWAGIAAGWPDLEGGGPEPGLQLLVLAAAASDRHMLEDPFWRRLLALPTRFTLADLADWVASAPALSLSGDESLPAGVRGRVGLPAGLGPPRVRRGVAALARRILARFAGRMPGFAAASAPFLRANLLGAGAALSGEADALQIRLERPPLDVLLSITGAGERELTFPDGRTVRLERRE